MTRLGSALHPTLEFENLVYDDVTVKESMIY